MQELESIRKDINESLKQFILGHEYLLEESCINNYYNKQNVSFVYCLRNEDTGLLKIGCTKDIISRMKQLISMFKNMIGINPKFTLEYLFLCNDKEEKKLESFLHNYFKQYRTFGEWFKIEKNNEDYLGICMPIMTINNIGITNYEGLIKELHMEDSDIDFNFQELYELKDCFQEWNIKKIIVDFKNINNAKINNKNENKIKAMNYLNANLNKAKKIDDLVIKRIPLENKININKIIDKLENIGLTFVLKEAN